VAQEYKEKIDTDFRAVCKDALSLLKNFLITKASQAESKVFYLKMKGGFIYLTEVTAGDDKKVIVDKSQQPCQEAFGISKKEMQSAHPIRLGLVLNFCVLLGESLLTCKDKPLLNFIQCD
jgi:14-3-3 protein beta/theta/zeta